MGAKERLKKLLDKNKEKKNHELRLKGKLNKGNGRKENRA